MDSVGTTLLEPLGSTLPMPSILTSVAKSVDHVSVEACPATIVGGFATSIALGAGAGGGGTGVGGVGFFLLQPATARISTRAETTLIHCILCNFNFVLPSREHSHQFMAAGGMCSFRSIDILKLSYLKLQLGCVFSPVLVSWRTWLPSANMLQICVRPLRLD